MSFLLTKTLRRLPTYVSTIFNEVFPKFTIPLLEYQLIGPYQPLYNEYDNTIPNSVFDEVILKMAVPKSKISPGRKRQKHGIHKLDRVEWHECARCGEPKLPHRICRKNIDICAMREEDWKVEKVKRDIEKARVEP